GIDRGQGLTAVAGEADGVALEAQGTVQGRPDGGVVVHDEDMHRPIVCAVPEGVLRAACGGGPGGSSSPPERSGGRQAANPPWVVGHSAGVDDDWRAAEG